MGGDITIAAWERQAIQVQLSLFPPGVSLFVPPGGPGMRTQRIGTSASSECPAAETTPSAAADQLSSVGSYPFQHDRAGALSHSGPGASPRKMRQVRRRPSGPHLANNGTS